MNNCMIAQENTQSLPSDEQDGLRLFQLELEKGKSMREVRPVLDEKRKRQDFEEDLIR